MKDCKTCIHLNKNCKGTLSDLENRKKLQASGVDCHESVPHQKVDALNSKMNDIFSKIDNSLKL